MKPKYVETDHEGRELGEEERQQLMEDKVRPSGFTKTNWKTIEAKRKWKELLKQMAHAKSEAEWRSVMSDKTDRKAAIIHIKNQNREKWLKRIGEHDLHFRPIRYTKSYEGFAHEHTGTAENDPDRMTYSVIAQNADVADQMEHAEKKKGGFERHNEVGKLLGFPKCDRDWFWDNWGTDATTDGWTDPMYEIAANSDSAEAIDGDRENVLITDPNPLNNILYRYWGMSFITHMPHAFDCKHSAEIGKARGEIMAESGLQDVANAMHTWLDQPMVWEGHLGIAHVKNDAWIGSANSSGYWSKKRIVWGEEPEGGEVV
jgi:hypothetical protein